MLRNLLGLSIAVLGLLLIAPTVDLSIETIRQFNVWKSNDDRLSRLVLRCGVNLMAINVSVVLFISGLRLTLRRRK